MVNNNDVYKDQIMLDHSSRTWSPRFFNQMMSDLNPLGWQIKSVNGITLVMEHIVSKKLLVTHVMHDLPLDIGPDAIIVTDVTVKDYPNKIFEIQPEIFGEFYHEFNYTNHIPLTKFNCFINRGCPFRQSWFYQLQRRGLLNQGYVSYWCEDRFNKTDPKDFYEELFKQNNQIFEKEHQELRGTIPFKNFDLSLEDAIIDSRMSVVIETWFHDNRHVCFSEKIWRSLQLPRPWLMFNVQHAVDHLRQWGFDVLDDYVDHHSYDRESSTIIRQKMILDQLEKDIVLTCDDLDDLEKRASYNRTLLKDLKDRWPEKYKNIVETIKNISRNESLT